MNRAIVLGSRMYHWGGSPLTAPTLLTLAVAALSATRSLVLRKLGTPAIPNRWLLVLAGAFFLIYGLQGISGRTWILAGGLILPMLGWAAGRFKRVNRPEISRSARVEKLVVMAIVLFGLAVRLYQLDVFPVRYTVDEQLFAKAALEVGEHPQSFFEQPDVRKIHLIRIAAIRLAFSAFGVGLFQHRTVSALEGTFTIFLVYILCKKLWGSKAGMFSAFLVAADPWHVGYSKFGVHEIEGPMFLALLLFVLIRAVRIGGKWNFALLGALTGATLYLYASCFVMAPFAIAVVVAGRFLAANRGRRGMSFAEICAFTAAFLLVLLPHLTIGWENLKEFLRLYGKSGNFLAAAEYSGLRPTHVFIGNVLRGFQAATQLMPKTHHPSNTFYPNPISGVLFLLGLGVLAGFRKTFENLLVLLWIPVAFLPAATGFGFAERRLFATLVPVPAMIGGLLLAKVWRVNESFGGFQSRNLSRMLVLFFLATISLTSLFLVYADTDSALGREPHPRKAAEFVRSIPPSYSVFISNRLKDFPFLLHLITYDRSRPGSDRAHIRWMEFEDIEAMAEEFALRPATALVVDPGPAEEMFLRKAQSMNPSATVIRQQDYWAILIPAEIRNNLSEE